MPVRKPTERALAVCSSLSALAPGPGLRAELTVPSPDRGFPAPLPRFHLKRSASKRPACKLAECHLVPLALGRNPESGMVRCRPLQFHGHSESAQWQSPCWSRLYLAAAREHSIGELNHDCTHRTDSTCAYHTDSEEAPQNRGFKLPRLADSRAFSFSRLPRPGAKRRIPHYCSSTHRGA